MSIRLYNSLSGKIEDFKPIKENEVSMYVCGPTVYNHAHIGNARPMIVFDTLRRLFEAQGYIVRYVSNYTDVDDKIIKKANEEGVEEQVVSKRYIEAYQQVRESLNTKQLYATPKVTETMHDIIHFIDELVQSNHAYVVDGDVYFRINSVEKYGSLSKQNLDDLQVGARIEENGKKENPMDFALWKETDMGIKWDSPWGQGRPGWHTECVVMIHKVLGDKIDIHGGGMDLRFPHHENEVAQSEALFHNSIANYWLHNAMININGEKMSKSLGNVSWAKDVIDMLGAPLVRWLMQSVSYRGELNFSDETIETARKELEKVTTAYKQAQVKIQLANKTCSTLNQEGYQRFLAAMNDDLNTPNAYAEIYETVKKLNQAVRQKEMNWEEVGTQINTLEAQLDVLGIQLSHIELTQEDKTIFANWSEAKAAKDFNKADELRALLIKRGLL